MKTMQSKEKSLEEIKVFIKKEIPFDTMEKNGGIYESSSIGKDEYGGDITIGVSYEENEEDGEFYYYNIFVGEEYIDVANGELVYLDDKIPTSILSKIRYGIYELLV